MNELRNNEEMTAKLRGRPWAKGTREAIIGLLVGQDFRELRSKEDLERENLERETPDPSIKY